MPYKNSAFFLSESKKIWKSDFLTLFSKINYILLFGINKVGPFLMYVPICTRGSWQFVVQLNFWTRKGVRIAAEKIKERHQFAVGDCRHCGPWIIGHNFSEWNIVWFHHPCRIVKKVSRKFLPWLTKLIIFCVLYTRVAKSHQTDLHVHKKMRNDRLQIY